MKKLLIQLYLPALIFKWQFFYVPGNLRLLGFQPLKRISYQIRSCWAFSAQPRPDPQTLLYFQQILFGDVFPSFFLEVQIVSRIVSDCSFADTFFRKSKDTVSCLIIRASSSLFKFVFSSFLRHFLAFKGFEAL